MKIVFTDRYEALGMKHPDPLTMCHGPCEGTGFYPLFCVSGLAGYAKRKWVEAGRVEPASPLGDKDRLAWSDAHFHQEHDCDGWHFVKCPDCGGTGRA